MSVLGAVYGGIAAYRRRSYERNPFRARRLASPVISVGNLAVGGSGKTPVAAALAELLLKQGERPAILSRGYGRRTASDGAVVVSDRGRICVTDPGRTGDEPQMLARMLPGVPVVVCGDRYLAGRLAESQLGISVILLDDGFQHLQLARDIDLVLVSREDLADDLLPAGRLREPLSAAATATALLVPGSAADASEVGAALGHDVLFNVATTHGAPIAIGGGGDPLSDATPRAVVAVAGIARPNRFFSALAAAGWDIRREISYRDHHWYTTAELGAVAAAARDANVSLVLTTQKDAVRMAAPLGAMDAAGGLQWAYVPMAAAIEPADRFGPWLLDRVRGARR